ncbi:MAG: leucine-rich repeat protein, partial [Candidatus Methanomethylophilaceae archaeon]|nr:leucine-rich repeat protein [Candidatus Methanomethylophilaceae archaeon]
YQLWNFYQWTLYKMMSYAVMGTKNSQALLGDGPAVGSAASRTGYADRLGPYEPGTSFYSKMFLENAWGSVSEFLGDTYISDSQLYAGAAPGGRGYPQSSGVYLPDSGWITSASSSSEFWDFPAATGSVDYLNFKNPGDYVFADTGRCVLTVGGNWGNERMAGISSLYAANGINPWFPNTGARLAYIMSEDALSPDYYEFEDGILTLTQSTPDYGEAKTPWITKGVKAVIVSKDVKKIGDYAFYGCASIETVLIAGNTTVGKGAFYGCVSLKEAIFSGNSTSVSSYAFSGCSSLEYVMLPNLTSAVGLYAFKDCSSLKSVAIPGNVRSFSNPFPGMEFYSASGKILSGKDITGKIFIADGIGKFVQATNGRTVSIGDLSFTVLSVAGRTLSVSGCAGGVSGIHIPASAGFFSVTDISAGAFSGNTDLKTVSIAKGIQTIGDGAFGGCVSIEEIGIPVSVTAIGDGAFSGLVFCDAGTVLGKTAGELSGYMYKGSGGVLDRNPSGFKVGTVFSEGKLTYKITSIEPLNVSVAGGEEGITDLVVPAEVSFEGKTFSVVSIGSNAFFKSTSLKTADLGCVTSIGSSAFKQCGNLVSVDVGENLKSIGSYAFYKCFKLKTINLEDSAKTMRSIGGYTFKSCSKLAQIAIPSYMNTIGKEAFSFGFLDENGNSLALTATELRGYLYKLSGGSLVRQSAPETGTVVADGDLVYSVTKYLPCTVSVTGYTGKPKNLVVPEFIVYEGLKYKVTSVAEKAFYGCKTLVSADLGNVSVIGNEAFYNCTKLASVKMDNVKTIGQSSFRWCTSLSSMELGESLADIKSAAFYKCRSIASLDLPDSLKTIAASAFKDCSGLKEISFGNGLTSVVSTAFSGKTFQDGDTVINVNAANLRGNAFEGTGSVLYLIF